MSDEDYKVACDAIALAREDRVAASSTIDEDDEEDISF